MVVLLIQVRMIEDSGMDESYLAEGETRQKAGDCRCLAKEIGNKDNENNNLLSRKRFCDFLLVFALMDGVGFKMTTECQAANAAKRFF